LPARVLIHGPCDGLRIKQEALPGRGTVGLVVAVNGDPRSLVWLGAIPANVQDAITTGPGDDFVKYESHWSGFYSMMDEAGHYTSVFPDGSSLTIGALTLPTTYRHIIGTDGKQDRVPMQPGDRVKNVPGAFPFQFSAANGITIKGDVKGNLTISGQENIRITTTNEIIINTPAKILEGNTTQPTYRLVDERLIALFNSHTHGGVETGPGESSGPSVQMAVGAETTTVLYAN